jgi:hypothetical protein
VGSLPLLHFREQPEHDGRAALPSGQQRHREQRRGTSGVQFCHSDSLALCFLDVLLGSGALREAIWHGLWRFSWVSGLRFRSQPVSSSVGSSPQLRGSRAPDQRSCGNRRLRGGAARSCELLALRSCGHRSLTGAPHEAGSCWHFTEPNRVANKRRGLPRGRLWRASFLLAETSVAAARPERRDEALCQGSRPRSASRRYSRCVSLSSPNTTALAAGSSSRSISNSPKVRVSGCPQNPIRSDPLARSRGA